MAYDLELAERIRDLLAEQPSFTEKKMFGGLAFLLGGHMTAVASSKGGLMIRADPAAAPGLVESTPATFAEMRGRQMKGWLRLDAADVGTDDLLSTWIDHAVDYAATLPPKA
jgi:TfoX/Sxy family transcriptional regulator of competence genes